MTETLQNVPENGLRYVCRTCVRAKGVREMSFEEINWYQSVTNAIPSASPTELSLCWVCGHLLKKYMQFLYQCQKAHSLLTQLSQEPNTYLPLDDKTHNWIHTKPTITSIAPAAAGAGAAHPLVADVDTKLENCAVETDCVYFVNDGDDGAISDDALPLTMIKADDDGAKKVKKNKKKKVNKHGEVTKHGESKTRRSELEQAGAGAGDGELHTRRPAAPAPAPAPREGFSPRMRQETDEYRVIKLTREQVLEEMRARESDERYVRAPHKCSLCVQGFNFEDVLASHMRKHSQERGAFACDMCSQRCPSAVSLRGHVKSHTTRYACKVCAVSRRCRQHLLEHYRSAHAPRAAPRYRCDRCPFTTTKRTVIQRHVRTTHGAGAGAGGCAAHACDQCGRRFKTIDALRVHISRHDATSALVCGECGRRFVFASLLRRHQQAVHERSDYYCVECDARFGSPYNLQLHFKRAKRHQDTSASVKTTS